MRSKRRSFKERICAAALAVLVALTGIVPGVPMDKVEAAAGDETVVTIEISDAATSDLVLEDVGITIEDASAAQITAESDGTYKLKQGEKYTYTLVKTGYDTAAGSFTTRVDQTSEKISLSMQMSAIQISAASGASTDLKVEDTVQLQVDNPITGVSYTWESSDPDTATVDENGLVTAVGEGTTATNITASYNGTISNPIAVNVTKTSVTLGLTADPAVGGEDIGSVTLTVTGLPGDATGTIEFSVNGNVEQRVESPDSPITDLEWVYENADIRGDYTFDAVYSGDHKYSAGTASVSVNGFDKTQNIVFDGVYTADQPKLLNNGESFTIAFDDDASFIQTTLSYVSSDTNVVTVDTTNGTVTSKGTGSACITVTAPADTVNHYQEAKAEYYVYVQESYSLEELINSGLTFSPTNKVYNGKNEVEITAELSPNAVNKWFVGDVDSTKPLTFTMKGTIAGKDVTKTPYDKVTITEITKITGIDKDGVTIVPLTDRLKNLVTEYQKEVEAEVTVKQRKVYLKTKGFTVPYGTDVKQAVESQEGLVEEGKNPDKDPDPDSGVIEEDKDDVDFNAFKATPVSDQKYNIGDYPKGIEVAGTNTYDSYPNYTFVEVEAERGTLSIIAAKLDLGTILEHVSFSVENGTLHRDDKKDENKIWISGGTLKATIDQDYGAYYTSVIFESENKEIDLVGGYDVSNIDETTVKNGSLYLKDGNNTCEKVEFNIIIDKTAPEFTFGKWVEKTDIFSDWLGTITFNRYTNTEYRIEGVDADDGAEGSGVKEWNYHVYKVNDDTMLNKSALQKYVNDGIAWNVGTGNEIPVISDSNEKLENIVGNYIVLVKVTDYVGNSIVYSSNGVVFDVEEPEVKILAADGSMIDANKYYNSDVGYQVQFTDPQVTSGFESAKIAVLDGKTVLEAEEVKFNEKDSYTLKQLEELAKKTVERTVKKEYSSNNLKIQVTAKDQAGNIKEAVQNLMIDSKAPVIDVQFSNDADVKNGKYFKTDRVMTITYSEKNIDKTNAGITFDVGNGAGIEAGTASKNVPLSELGKYDIKYAWIEDNQADKNVSTFTDDRKNVLQLTFDVDNEYYIVPHCKDLAGNTEKISYDNYENIKGFADHFVIDKTAPVIDAVTYTTNGEGLPASISPNTVYSQTTIQAVIGITEKNFWLSENDFSEEPDQLDFSATKETEVGGGKTALNTVDYRDQAARNSQCNGGKATILMEFAPDANYTFGFTYTDLAGNEAVYEPHYFTVDHTLPEGSISIDGQSIWDKAFQVITFNIFKNSTYQVTLTAEDYTAGIASAAYYKAEQPFNTKEELEAVGEQQWIKATSFEVAPNEQYVVYGRIIDKAGNMRYIYPTHGAIADNVKPEITITNLSTAWNGVFAGNVTLNVAVTDPTAGNTYSGLEKIWYDVVSTGNVVNSKTEVLADNSGNRVKGNKDFNQDIVIIASEFNSNDVQVQVHALDFTGNQYDSEIIPLKIDITAPVIESVAWNTSAAANGKYYNVTRVATITVKERNFDPNQVRLNITNTDGTSAEVSGWNVDDSGTSDNNINTCTVTFAADGDYNMNVDCTDKAGNSSNTQTVDEFTIDKTVPTINVTFDNNDVRNGKYYNAGRTATITVNEHNFSGPDVQTAITSSTGVPSVNGWSTGGDVNTAAVSFTADGDYSFTVNYTDLAGNAASAYNVDGFVVDQTKPEIEIFDIADKSANNGEVAPGVRYSDTNYDVNGVSVTYSGPKHKEKAVDGVRTGIPNGESIKMADFDHTEETDDIYTMVAKVTDFAGNSDEKQVIFSVNRFGSNFIFSDSTEKFLDEYYNKEEETLVVTEVNVDTLEHKNITCGHDGEMTEYKEGKDYTVKASGEEVSWKSYQYTINKRNFEKEGLYNITINSVDRAENQMNNKIKEAGIEFVIDKTAPSVVITGVEDDGRYRASKRDITVSTTDNVAMERVEVYVDDTEKPAETYNAETIQRQKGELPYTLNYSSDWQRVKAIAIDKAGNMTDTSKTGGSDSEKWISVLVTSNAFVQFYRNTPVLIGTVFVLLVSGLALITFGVRKHKDGKEAQK